MNPSKDILKDEWLEVSSEMPDGVIRTLHTDGKEDVCKVIGNVIYSFDAITDEPITHYKTILPSH